MQQHNSDARSSEAWRRECEARWVLSLPTLNERRYYIQQVEAKRGKPAAEQLKRDITDEHNKKKTGAQATQSKRQQ